MDHAPSPPPYVPVHYLVPKVADLETIGKQSPLAVHGELGHELDAEQLKETGAVDILQARAATSSGTRRIVILDWEHRKHGAR
jgi:hypothetical protein